MTTCDWGLPNEFPLKKGSHPCGKKATWKWHGSNRRGEVWVVYYCDEHYSAFNDPDRPEWESLTPTRKVIEARERKL